MKKLLYTLAAVLMSQLVVGQTPNKNYVKTTTYQVKTQNGTTNATTSQNLTDDEKIESITYFDGLGRPVQSIAKQAGGNKQDIITPVVYDDYGRQTKDYLPFERGTSSLNFETSLLPNIDGDIIAINTFYNNKYPADFIGMSINDVNPFSEKHLEASPLNRVLEQGAPGSDWLANPLSDTDHTIKFAYQSNAENEVELFRAIFPTLNTEQPQLYYEGLYAANELYKTITKDENWQPNTNPSIINKAHTTEEFKNAQGQVVLKRTYDSQEVEHDTYYIYDDYGNLSYVLSPKGSGSVIQSNRYQDYTDNLKYTEFVPVDKFGNPIETGEGTTSVTIDEDLLKITIIFDLSFDSSINLKTGPIALLDSNLPNMIIGSITTGGVNYLVSIQDGYLFIAGSGLLSGVSQSFTLDLPEYSVATNVLDDLCYQYRYDKRNRLVEKKIPQKGWEYIVYDKLDRPVLTQDAILRASNFWLFTKYDAFDRIVYTGRLSGGSNRTSLQTILNNQSNLNESCTTTATLIDGVNVYYSKSAYPTSINKLYTVNYYDSYSSDVTSLFPNPTPVLGQTVSTSTKSLPTASKVRVLDTNNWITSVTYYDDKARPIYSASKNDYLSTTDVVKMQLDFIGKTIKTESSHTKGTNTAIVVTDDYTYDHAGRMLTQKQKIGTGAQELIVKNTYDELGQLKDKKVGNTETTPLQTVDYSYNIRGWLKQINNPQSLGNDLFTFAINYNTTTLGQNNQALYNGNISETIWKTANDTGSNTTRGYAYEYDALNRLNTANMSINTGSGFALASGYHENGLLYDKNGNIMSLQRTGATIVFDNLTYIYNGNQLSKVTDAVTNQQTEGFIDGNTVGSDYTYDINGNMKTDKNKGITNIVYNHLNLPTQVNFGSTNKIQYVYDATGVKLKKRVDDTGQSTFTSYAGNYIYENTGAETLKFFSHPEGYVEPDGQGNFDYIYQYKDHLGNVRLSYSDSDGDGSINASTEIIEENNYYPFGLEHKGYNNIVSSNSNSVASKFKYNGVEHEESLGLNLYEMDLRQYDPAIARWTSIDPVTHWSMSTYTAFDNNPVFFADPSGADSIYNFDTQQYVINGQVVTQDEAIAYAQSGGNADGSNNNKPSAYHSYVPNKNKKGVTLETGTDVVSEVTSTTSSEVKEDGTKIYTTLTTSITTMIDENGTILKDQIEVVAWITTTTVSGDNTGDREHETLKLSDNNFGYQNLSPNVKKQIERIASFKSNNGYSNLRDVRDNRNRAIDVTLGTIAAVITAGQSTQVQLATGAGVGLGSSFFNVFDTSNIKVKLY
uniref:DUF6443 domain-containing protein n=1 Tax=Gelidibacter sp. TaxID=2018083 RepID=UPI004049E96C